MEGGKVTACQRDNLPSLTKQKKKKEFLIWRPFHSFLPPVCVLVESASQETDVFEMDLTEQLEGVEAGVGGQLNSSGHAVSVAVMPQWTLEHRVFVYDSFVKKW